MLNKDITITIDAVGLLCPLPVLKLKKALKNCNEGEIVKLIASDPAASIDVPHFCHESGNIFIRDEVEKNFLNANFTSSEHKKPRAYFIQKRNKGSR